MEAVCIVEAESVILYCPDKKKVPPFLPTLVNAEVCSYSSFLFRTVAVTDSYISILFITAVVVNKKLEYEHASVFTNFGKNGDTTFFLIRTVCLKYAVDRSNTAAFFFRQGCCHNQ